MSPAPGTAPPSRVRTVLRWSRRIALVLGALVVIAALAGAAFQALATSRDEDRFPPPGEMVDIGTHRLHLLCEGEGSPTVILDGPSGSSGLGFSLVQPGIAEFARVCAFDRAGYGWSEPGPGPRTGLQIAAEMQALLEAAALPGPFVLVGASVGGGHVRLLASLIPDRTAGMVLVDAVHEEQNVRMPPSARLTPGQVRVIGLLRVASRLGVLRLAGVSVGEGSMGALPAELQPMARAVGFRSSWVSAIHQEVTSFEATLAQLTDVAGVGAPAPLGDRPLVVLTHGRPDEASEDAMAAEAVWQELQQELLGLSTDGVQVIATESGHFIQIDQPDAVVDAVRRVVDSVRARSQPGRFDGSAP